MHCAKNTATASNKKTYWLEELDRLGLNVVALTQVQMTALTHKSNKQQATNAAKQMIDLQKHELRTC